MTNFRKGLLLLVFLFTSAVSAQNLTLQDAIDMALQKNDKIKEYEAKLAQKEQSETQAMGNFLPTLTLEGSYNHLNDDMITDLNPIRTALIAMQSKNMVQFANIQHTMTTGTTLPLPVQQNLEGQYSAQLGAMIPSFSQIFYHQNMFRASLTAVQPLFLGGKLLAARRYAISEKNSSSEELKQVRNEITKETTDNYFTMIFMQSLIRTRAEVLKGMQNHKADAQRLFEVGLIANYHLLRAEVAVADAERNLSDDQNNLDLAKIALRHSMGLPDDAAISTSDSLVYQEAKDSIKELLARAYENQPILRMINQKKEAAKENYNVKFSEYMPQLAAYGKYELNDHYLASIEPKWSVGLQFKMNLFNGLKDKSSLESAKLLETEVGYLESDAKRKIELWVNKSYKDVCNAQNRYKKLLPTINLAEENLRMNEKRFETGMSTSLEVIDARLSLEKDRIERLVSLLNYYKSLTDLYLAAGNPAEIINVWNLKEK